MTLLTRSDTTDTYQATVGADTIEVTTDVFDTSVGDLARIYYDSGMQWDASQVRALSELMQAEVWFSPHMEGVKINGRTYTEEFQSNIEQFVRDGLITREPIPGQGIAVKYLKDEYQPIALAELDRQGK